MAAPAINTTGFHPAIEQGAPTASLLDQILDHQTAISLGKSLVPTGYLPDHIKTPEQAMAIILAGQELGMKPMRALRSLVMVKGKVTESADSQLARFKADGGRSKFLKLTETEAVLWLRHPNGDEHTETFTLEDARKAGLVGAGGMYQKYPKAMLRSRAITAGLKSVGWEGGVGNYDPDELAHIAPPAAHDEPEPAREQPAKATTEQRARLRALAGHPAVPTPVREKVHEALTGTRLSAAKADEWITKLEDRIAATPAVDVPDASTFDDRAAHADTRED